MRLRFACSNPFFSKPEEKNQKPQNQTHVVSEEAPKNHDDVGGAAGDDRGKEDQKAEFRSPAGSRHREDRTDQHIERTCDDYRNQADVFNADRHAQNIGESVKDHQLDDVDRDGQEKEPLVLRENLDVSVEVSQEFSNRISRLIFISDQLDLSQKMDHIDAEKERCPSGSGDEGEPGDDEKIDREPDDDQTRCLCVKGDQFAVPEEVGNEGEKS